MTLLKFEGTKYRSELDEKAFFDWIKAIKSVISYYGEGRTLFLEVKGNRISDRDLRELIALAFRYNCEMRQFKQFKNKTNSKWFYDNKEAFWFSNVFGE